MTTNALNVNGALTGTTVTATSQFNGAGGSITGIPASNITGTFGIGGGGTGAITASSAFAALSPQTTAGDIIGFTTVPTRVAVGSTIGQQLFANAGATASLTWFNVPNNINVGLSTGVAGGALTITLTQADGTSAPTASAPVTVNFSGGNIYFNVLQSATLTLTIPSGTTIGTVNSDTRYIYIYAMDASGALVLAVSLTPFDLSARTSSTAISGGASAATLYSTAAQTGLLIAYLGKILAPQATAGTWASNATEIFVGNSASDYAGGQAPVQTDGVTLTGTGTQTSLLGIAPVGSSGSSYGFGFTAAATGQITAALNTGNAFMVQFQQIQSIASGAVATVLANNLTPGTSYRTQTAPTVSSFATATGIYTCGQNGFYFVSCSSTYPASAGGTNRQLLIVKTDALATAQVQSQQTCALVTASFATPVTISQVIYCKSTDTLWVQAFQDSGATLTNCAFNVSFTFICTGV